MIASMALNLISIALTTNSSYKYHADFYDSMTHAKIEAYSTQIQYSIIYM